MSRPTIPVIAVLMLVAGVAVGIAACDQAQPAPTGPAAVVSSPSTSAQKK